MDLETEIAKIMAILNPEWDQLEQARAIYIAVGKIVEKNAEFFLTQAQKLQKNALSKEEMERIHEASEHLFTTADWYRIICRSGARLLKIFYDRANIPSHLVKSIDYMWLNKEKKVKVFHWILSLDIDDSHYALTIAHDLSNIKNNFATEHFGVKFPKYDSYGNEYYEGEDLSFKAIPKEKLKAIDDKIGYLKTQFTFSKKQELDYDDYSLSILRKGLLNNKIYNEHIVKDTSLYKNLFTLLDDDDNIISAISIEPKTLFTKYFGQLIKNVAIEVERALKQSLGISTPVLKFTTFENWIKEICTLLNSDLIETYGIQNEELFAVPANFNFGLWRSKQKSLVCPYKLYDDNLQLLDKVYSYVQIIFELHQDYSRNHITQETLKRIKRFRALRGSIAMHFLPEVSIFEKNIELVNDKPYIKSNYINEKFKAMFSIVFNVNTPPTAFNSLEYSEQIHCFNKIIPLIFEELSSLNCGQAPAYNISIPPTANRIRYYTLYNEITHHYEIVFHIPSFFDFEDEFYYHYDLQKNTFQQIDIIEDIFKNHNYEIISTSLREKLQKGIVFDELLAEEKTAKLKH